MGGRVDIAYAGMVIEMFSRELTSPAGERSSAKLVVRVFWRGIAAKKNIAEYEI
jgi:hypothetical protein